MTEALPLPASSIASSERERTENSRWHVYPSEEFNDAEEFSFNDERLLISFHFLKHSQNMFIATMKVVLVTQKNRDPPDIDTVLFINMFQ